MWGLWGKISYKRKEIEIFLMKKTIFWIKYLKKKKNRYLWTIITIIMIYFILIKILGMMKKKTSLKLNSGRKVLLCLLLTKRTNFLIIIMIYSSTKISSLVKVKVPLKEVKAKSHINRNKKLWCGNHRTWNQFQSGKVKKKFWRSLIRI